MNTKTNIAEKGQSMVMVALAAIAFIAIMGLAIDGGYSYYERRVAQNAADAGALAGASQLCMKFASQDEAEAAAETIAWDYAVNRNDAHTASPNAVGRMITVSTSISYTTFFAGLIGAPQVVANATASAGCGSPCAGEGILPVAWACHPPITGTIGDDGCAIDYGTMDTPGPLYIIMDSPDTGVDFFCQDPPNSGLPVNSLDCDLNNDGYDDAFASGNRSWLDLNGGGGGAAELKSWINDGFPGKIEAHTWLGGSPGVEVTVFQTVHNRVGDYVLLPVFDMICSGLPETTCPGSIHALLDPPTVPSGAGSFYFHIISFSYFKITCVSSQQNQQCPGKTEFLAANPDIKNADKWKTIEGYFVKDYAPGLSGKCDLGDAGAYTVYLSTPMLSH